MFTSNTSKKPEIINGGPLKTSYVFSQFHFHWSDNDTFGSEDSINGKHFPMELHMVFYKKEYGSIDEALTHSDGLTVLAFFYIISQKSNSAYIEISEALKRIVKAQTSTELSYPLSLGDYIHEYVDDYFTYHGSLTTPPCLDKYFTLFIYLT